MRVEKIGDLQIIQSNPTNPYFSYFAWPTAARLQDGRIAVVSSGLRNDHICPFGKVVISYSDDEGKTFTSPTVLFDTSIDDRDPGIVAYGDSNVIITALNCTVSELQNRCRAGFWKAYVETCITKDAEEKYYGSIYRISRDCGKTFGEIKRAPVGTPHGPTPLGDGSLLWIGHHKGLEFKSDDNIIYVYKMTPDEEFIPLGSIEPIIYNGAPLLSEEPHVMKLPNGRLLCHIRAERGHEREVFTTYQCYSDDEGKTWSTPERIIPILEGATSYLSMHSSGVLLSCFERRQPPFEIKVMFSTDNGETWNYDNTIFSRELYENFRVWNPDDDYPANDLGYPSTVELSDKSLLTVFYSRYPNLTDKALVLGQRWKLTE